MKKFSIALACAAIAAFATTSIPTVKADTLNVGGDIGVFSDYVWRGVSQGDAFNGVAVQGDVVLSTDALDGLSASAWGSNTTFLPVTSSQSNVQEWDLVLDYSNTIEDINLSYSAGAIWYTFLHNGDANFGEVYLGLSYDAIVSPFVTVYYRVDDLHDWWIDVGASGSLGGYDLSAMLSFAVYDDDPVLRPASLTSTDFDDGTNLITLSASKDFTVSDLTVTPSVTGTIPVVSKSPLTASTPGERLIYGLVADPSVVIGVNVAF